ncbi:MAG TPA: hypothetical protein VFN95_02555 [Flavitalea sp.]|nr:hypothetical protein [Flavitalea sp.]
MPKAIGTRYQLRSNAKLNSNKVLTKKGCSNNDIATAEEAVVSTVLIITPERY